MEEEEAHRLYTLFQRTNDAAKTKKGLGFSSSEPPARGAYAAPTAAAGGFMSSFVRSTTAFGAEQTKAPPVQAPTLGGSYDSDDAGERAAKRQRQQRASAYNAVADERDDDPRFWGRGADHPGRGGLGGRRRHPEEEAEEPEEAEDEAEVRRRLQAKEKQRREREAAAWERHRAEGGGDEGRSGRHVGASGGGSGSRRDVAPAGAGGKTRGKDQPPDYSALIPGYEAMNPAEKLRARTRLSLAQAETRVASRAAAAAAGSDDEDGSGGAGGKGNWTRFAFNADAVPEDGMAFGRRGGGGGGGEDEPREPKQYNSHGLGADLDRGELEMLVGRRTADVERQQRAEQKAQAAHEDAIFGSRLPPPPPLPTARAEPGRDEREQPPPLAPPPPAVYAAAAAPTAAVGAAAAAPTAAVSGMHAGDDEGPQVVLLDEMELVAAERAAAGLASASCGAGSSVAGAGSTAGDGEPADGVLEGTLHETVLSNQKMSWRERAIQARRKAAG
eukprot:XP_001700883.1 predicted protein [Chlamydomonas reinhardtii]